MKQDDALIEQHTSNWISSFIINLNICPFAKRVDDNNTLKLKVCSAKTTSEALEALMIEVTELDKKPEIETTLLIFSSLLENFLDYLDFLELAEILLFEQNYEGIYQLASFHPH